MSHKFFGGSYSRDHGWRWGWQDLGEALGYAGVNLGKNARFFENGEVRLAILSLLEEGPKHGYQLMKELQERSGGMYRASAGAIYPTLQLLADEGLIESEKKEGRHVHSLTDLGRAELARDPEAVRRIWERAESWGDWAQQASPRAMLLTASSLKPFLKSAFRAAEWADGNSRREEQVKKIIRRAAEDLEDLAKEDHG
jgi:DNA-binding PadR family transcriptional regulator